jgi:hypothetical protein
MPGSTCCRSLSFLIYKSIVADLAPVVQQPLEFYDLQFAMEARREKPGGDANTDQSLKNEAYSPARNPRCFSR